jgi:virginiamycin B lyase
MLTAFPTPDGYPAQSLTVGPDGNLWYVTNTASDQREIIRMTPAGRTTSFVISAAGETVEPAFLSPGPDGNLWFVRSDSAIGRITPDGQVSTFRVPTAHGVLGTPLVAGGDGDLYFGEIGRIGRISPAGVVSEFPIPGAQPPTGNPFHLARAGDGLIYFTEVGGQIGRIRPDGTIMQFATGSPTEIQSFLSAGDGAIWFTNRDGYLHRLDPRTGAVTALMTAAPPELEPSIDLAVGAGQTLLWLAIGTMVERVNQEAGKVVPVGEVPDGSVGGMVSGPDGNLWFTQFTGVDQVGRMTPAGQVATFPVTARSTPSEIIVGHDGNLWFTEFHAAQVGRITP